MEDLKDQIEKFLNIFKYKCKFFSLVLNYERSKNYQTLLCLDINRSEVESILQTLVVEEYSEGPIKNNMPNLPDLWVFGKEIKGKEIYIKIHEGMSETSPICISFHIAEYQMNYPLKNE